MFLNIALGTPPFVLMILLRTARLFAITVRAYVVFLFLSFLCFIFALWNFDDLHKRQHFVMEMTLYALQKHLMLLLIFVEKPQTCVVS